ncbi:phosphoribosylamine--glycine ligase [Candidiatus Paracoxiella cheracis]|uniref:phosphoribosylamine--glycine ligase n=1 Tax=Candidiatus Paracoxiella cheracis TaxID=3405120 RepID=UPI003BF51087
MNILIIGNGGREHAIAWQVAQAPTVEKVWVAPGNAGTATEFKTHNVPISPTDTEALVRFAHDKNIDLTIVGPEAPLATGVVDAFTKHGLKCFGPTQQAAQLETSKAYCKHFLREHHIPTAQYAVFQDKKDALDYIKTQSFPLVIKASGLAAGKGVIIANDKEEAQAAILAMLEGNAFGHAGHEIVIEEFLTGEELSFIVMADGEHILPLATSQDHKRRDDGDQGPNTGGMGAYSPVPRMNEALNTKIMREVIEPTITALRLHGSPYTGFLYAGLMISPNGEPKVLEFNCRLGDPETQPLMMRLKSNLTELCMAALAGQLNQVSVVWDPRPALAVVMASGGYPDAYHKGDIITGLEESGDPDIKVFHAGTAFKDQSVVTSGGRVLAVTALGDNLLEAQEKAYQRARLIHWPNCFYRTDIGYRAIEQSQ